MVKCHNEWNSIYFNKTICKTAILFTNHTRKTIELIPIMCSNDPNDLNNALHRCEGAKDTLILKYGPYMNWGRWNHNTRRVKCIINELLDRKFNVQLQFTGVETTWPDHGTVEIYSQSGELLSRAEKFQHNMTVNSSDMLKAMTDEAEGKVSAKL